MADRYCDELRARAAMLHQEADLGRRRAEERGQDWEDYQDQLRIADRFEVMAVKAETAIAANCGGVAEPAPSGRVFTPPSSLQNRVGPRNREAELRALAQAEAALAMLSANFDAWMEDDLAKLYTARNAMLVHGTNKSTIDLLFTPALDLKGLGGTYNFPLVARLAASLCRLLENSDEDLSGLLPLVASHVAAIRASVREKVRSDDDPVGSALAGELERHTTSYLAGSPDSGRR